MSCGVCSPGSFRENYQAKRVFGYAHSTSSNAYLKVRELYFQGAELVVWDESPTPGTHFFERGSIKLLCKLLRKGDALLVSDDAALGDRPRRRKYIINQFCAMGVDVYVSTKNWGL